MEIGLIPEIHTYSGGLGILAGDTLKGAADIGLSMLGITLLYRKGYVRQQISEQGEQRDREDPWKVEKYLELGPSFSLSLFQKKFTVRAWQYTIQGLATQNKVYFLDTSLPDNPPEIRSLTQRLYGGDERHRLRQEALLAFGGVKLLEILGHSQGLYHLNEGHTAFVPLALLEREDKNTKGRAFQKLVKKISQRCVFTTHTPVPAGHDRFPKKLLQKELPKTAKYLERLKLFQNRELNMTEVALRFSRYKGAVSFQNHKVIQKMFPHHTIDWVTNGIHLPTWVSPFMQKVFSKHCPSWEKDPYVLRTAFEIPAKDIQKAHQKAKRELLKRAQRFSPLPLKETVFTIGFARRLTAYKRADFLFQDFSKLLRLAKDYPFQILYAGRAHPKDKEGKTLLEKLFLFREKLLAQGIPFVYVPNYDMKWGLLFTSGVDLWLNTPLKPLEASGTSGMKAAVNGVPSLSVKDGWWVEGLVEDMTGWEIEDPSYERYRLPKRLVQEGAKSLYQKLRNCLRLYYRSPEKWQEKMKGAIALNGSFFHIQRMIWEYQKKAYE